MNSGFLQVVGVWRGVEEECTFLSKALVFSHTNICVEMGGTQRLNLNTEG